MKSTSKAVGLFIAALSLWGSVPVVKAEQAINTVGANGYDLVSYQTGKPVRGNGYATYAYKGVTYLFSSEANKKLFVANPEKYLPAYGGYCAYGVSLGKKVNGDPEVWEFVNGKLYLNVSPEVKKTWSKDKEGNIRKADSKWPGIEEKPAASLL